MSLCRLCLTEQNLIRAHVIPAAFFCVQRVNGEAPPMLLTNTRGAYTKKAPIGVYDEGILCSACENKFQKLDDYGIKVLLKRFDDFFHPIQQGGQIVEYESSGIDQLLLLRFFVSVLWRASVSTQSFYKRVALGPYDADAAIAVNSPHLPVPAAFAAVLSRWRTTDENDGAADGMLDPIREKLVGVNTYRFYFGRIVARLKASNQPFPAQLSCVELGSDPMLRIVTRDFGESKDLATMVSVVTTVDSRR
jgi:hypothetical protein